MTYNQLWHRLVPLYTEGEAKAIVRRVLEDQFGLSFTEIVSGKVSELSPEQTDFLEEIMVRLSTAEPVQYVLGREMFCGRTFHVDRRVLIPRPETALLCEHIVDALSGEAPAALRLLDIGTGSGCIAITLALELSDVQVHGWDISDSALAVARQNARRLGAQVKWGRHDILDMEGNAQRWDAIVSNPPYICQHEQAQIHRNVLDYEPHSALFVPDDDPLKYYRAIARYAVAHLNGNGILWLEINHAYAGQLTALLLAAGFRQVEMMPDQQGDDRFVKAAL